MAGIFFIVGLITLVSGIAAFSGAISAVQEAPATIIALIGVVFMVGGAIIEQLKYLRKDLAKLSTKEKH